jgi:haloalkane dehalogenase
MELLRTPNDRFADLPDFPFEPRYTPVAADDGSDVRVAHVEVGEGRPVLLMHGEPSWSFLYRHVMPIVADAGLRAIAPDLVGFGRSDKPAAQSDYTYARHVTWMSAWLEAVDLTDVVLFAQDWGGLIGLRLVAAHPDRFAAVVVANTGLPTGDQRMSEAFLRWQEFSRTSERFDISRIVGNGTVGGLTQAEVAAYDAPFPNDSFKAGARIFPSLVPTSPEDPAAADQRRAWAALAAWEKPFVTAFSDADPITAGWERPFHELVPGASGSPHRTIEGAGHFLQEDAPAEVAAAILDAAALVPGSRKPS